jgi:hypothetical protein
MNGQRNGYLAYLLRLWQVERKDGIACRATLQSPHSGEHIGFDSLEELFDFLREQSGMTSDLKD